MNPETNREYAIRERITSRKSNAKRMAWITFSIEDVLVSVSPDDAEDVFVERGVQYAYSRIFNFKVWVEAMRMEQIFRTNEFKRWCEDLYENNAGEEMLSLNKVSCEKAADDLYSAIATRFPSRDVWIEVEFSGNNGMFVKYENHLPARFS